MHIDVGFSVGFSTLYDNNSYERKSYYYSSYFNQFFIKHTVIERVEYKIIPVNIIVDYLFFPGKVSPFLTAMFGFNISGAFEEGKNFEKGGYQNIEDIPTEYKKNPSTLDDGSSITAGIGFGFKYIISKNINVNFTYTYHYNKAIINNHQISFGVTFVALRH